MRNRVSNGRRPYPDLRQQDARSLACRMMMDPPNAEVVQRARHAPGRGAKWARAHATRTMAGKKASEEEEEEEDASATPLRTSMGTPR